MTDRIFIKPKRIIMHKTMINNNLALLLMGLAVTTLSASHESLVLIDDFSQAGKTAGVAANWHLDVVEKNIVTSLSDDCVSKPTAQRFDMVSEEKPAKGYFMTGGRIHGPKDDFVRLESGAVYEFSFHAKKVGDCKAGVSLLLFSEPNWKSQLLPPKYVATINSPKWEKYKFILRTPENVNATVVHFTIEGKHGSVLVDDVMIKKTSSANEDKSTKYGLTLGVTDDFSLAGENAGVAANWHLDIVEKTIIPTLSEDCVSSPTAQRFDISSDENPAKGYFMTGGRVRGSQDDFILLESGAIYELSFHAKKAGDCKAGISLLLFSKPDWKYQLLPPKHAAAINSLAWEKYKFILRTPENVAATVVHLAIEGKNGSVWIDDLTLKQVFIPPTVIDGKPMEKSVSRNSKFIFNPVPSSNPHIGVAGYSVAQISGIPTLCYNGIPFFAQLFFNAEWNPEKVKSQQAEDFIGAGINFTLLAAALPWDQEFASGDVAQYGNPHANLDKRINNILQMNSEMKFLVNVHLNVPRSWYNNHPDEILAADDGTPVSLGQHRTSAAISRASLLCRQESGKRLAQLISHIDRQEYSGSVMGFILFFGQSGEWNWFIPREKVPNMEKLADLAIDHSPASKTAFIDWLKVNYNHDIVKMNMAWGTALSDFTQAKIPLERDLNEMVGSVFSNINHYRKIYDYWCYYSEEQTKTLLHFARIAKQTSKINRLVGAYYGGDEIYGTVGGAKNVLRHGGGGMKIVLKSPDIDFFCNPNFYSIEQAGKHCPTQSLVDSILMHGKFHFFEYDHPTSTGDFDPAHNSFANHNKKRAPQNLRESISIMKRDFSWVICKGLGIWWWEMGRNSSEGSWFNDPSILATLKSFQHIGQNSLTSDRSSVSEIAVIYSAESFRALKPQWHGIGRDIVVEQLDAFGKIGAPYDLYLFSDLGQMRPYKLYVFWNLFLTNENEQLKVKEILKKNNATALWIYAPGFVSLDNGKSVNTMETLTGIKFTEESGELLSINITNPHHPISKNHYGQRIGLNQNAPLFHVCDNDIIVLGRSSLTNKPVFVVKENPGWTSIHIGVYPVPASLFRDIARYSGVHIYNNKDDVLAVNKSYLSIHSIISGERTIELPIECDIYDLFSQKYVKRNSRQFQIHLNAPETLLFKTTHPTTDVAD